MMFMPYIHFDGSCAEAMPFYADVFGATDLQIMKYSDTPPGRDNPVQSDRIMHSQFSVDGATLMASDFPPGAGQPQAGMSVMIAPKSVARGKELFDKLSDGGAPVAEFGPTFFSAGFGMFKDRFGTHWIIGAQPD